MILFACPNPACKKRHAASDELAGEVLVCDAEGCDYRIVVPAPPEEPVELTREPVPGEPIDEETGAVLKDWRAEVPTAHPPSRPPRRGRLVDRDAPRNRPPRRESGFRCPFCRTHEYPRVLSRISAGGWVVFAVLLFVFLPLFWIGLLMKEEYRVCRECGLRLDR